MWSKYPDIQKELNSIEGLIKRNVRSRNRLLTDVGGDLIGAGGKRLRPALVVISAGFGRGSNEKIHAIAGGVEILHSATLVHDDIIDRTHLRRGKPTVAQKYGIDMAVYTGDYLFTKAVLLLSRNASMETLETVAKSIKTICEGEVDQYRDRYNAEISVSAYLKRIKSKTAELFGAACALGASVAGCGRLLTRKLYRFGSCYGMAFQIRDDLNDIMSDAKTAGKPVLNDISEGTITLPVIYAMRKSADVRELVNKYASERTVLTPEEAESLLRLVIDCGGVKDAKAMLEKYINKGMDLLDSMPDKSSKRVLKDLLLDLKV